MRPDGMPFGDHPPHDFRVSKGPVTDEEEGGDEAEPPQLIQDGGCVFRVRTVVKGECHGSPAAVEPLMYVKPAHGSMGTPASRPADRVASEEAWRVPHGPMVASIVHTFRARVHRSPSPG